MGFIKFSNYQGLHLYNDKSQPILEDTSINSPDYFRVSQFPDTLTAGKNAFYITGNTQTIEPKSEIKFECLGPDGKPVYMEVPSWIDIQGRRMLTIWVYPWTPPGQAMITLLAKRHGKSGSQGLVRWRRLININPFAVNKTPIVFGRKPRVYVRETVKEYLEQSYPIGDTATATISTGQVSIATVNNDTFLYASGDLTFTSDMVGGNVIIDSSDIQYSLSAGLTLNATTPAGDNNLNQGYDGYITEIVNNTTAKLDQPFVLNNLTYSFGSWYSFPVSTVQPDVSDSDYSMTYIQTPVYTTGSSNDESYANIILSNIEPIAGDAATVKTFMRSAGFNNWELVGERNLDHAELLIDGDSWELTKKMGYAVDEYTINTYWSSSAHGYDRSIDQPSLTRQSSSIIDAIRISGSEQLGDGLANSADRANAYIRTNCTKPIQFYKDCTYQISFKQSNTTDLFDGFPPELVIYMSGSAFNNIDENGLETDSTLGKKVTSIGEENTFSTWQSAVNNITSNPNFIPGTVWTGNPAMNQQAVSTPAAMGSPPFSGKTVVGQNPASTLTYWEKAGANLVPDPDRIVYSFTADKDGTGVPVFQVKAGRWDLSQISIQSVVLPGFTPNHTFLLTHVPQEKMNDLLDFKFEFYDADGNIANVGQGATALISSSIEFSGSNTFIEEAILAGPMLMGQNAASAGFQFATPHSAMIRTIGPDYPGHRNVKGKKGGGIIIWSGSLSGAGKTYGTDSGSYHGVGMELAASESWLRFHTDVTGDGTRSLLDIRTKSFFVGNPGTQFISGSDDNIEISSSNFHLAPTGDVIMQGTITAEAGGVIGGAAIGSHSMAYDPYWVISASADTSDPVSFISSSGFKVSAGGQTTASNLLLTGGTIDASPYWKIDRSTDDSLPAGFISSSDFKVSAGGRMTASSGLIAGATIGATSLAYNPYWKIEASTSTTDPGSFISSSKFKVRADGTVTASAIQLTGGKLTNPPYWVIDNSTNATLPGGFISSSAFKVSADGRATGSDVLFSGGKIASWIINGDDLQTEGYSSNQGIRLHGGDTPEIRLVRDASGDYVRMHFNTTSDWGMSGYKNGNALFQLGSTNQIAGIEFASASLSVGNIWSISASQQPHDPASFISSSKFKVSADGRMTASDANIEGKLTATTGKIANWDIDGNVLSRVNASNKGIILDADPSTQAIEIREDDDNRIQIYHTTADNWGIIGRQGGNNVFLLGDPNGQGNKIAGISFVSASLFTTKWRISSSANDTDPVSFISSSDFKISADGRVTASDMRLEGGVIQAPPYWKIDRSSDITDPGSFISSSKFKVRADGTVTASSILLSQGTLDNPPYWKIDNKTDVSLPAGFISSSIFKISADGRVTASNILAAGGKIGGATIGSGSLSFGTRWAISASDDTTPGSFISSSFFKVSTDGRVTASAMSMSGNIVALSGQIGGATIGSDSLKYHPYWEISSSDTTSDPASFISSSLFKVSAGGVITGSLVHFGGGGQIAGFSISSDTLSADNFELDAAGKRITLGTGNDIFIADGDEGIQLGHATFASAPFSVTKEGALSAESGQVAGWTLSSTQIKGGDLVLDKLGIIRSDPFVSNQDGGGFILSAVSGGYLEVQNAKIRGTLATTVFEKESVNAVGGQLFVANSTVISSSAWSGSGVGAADATMSVENVSGLSGSILQIKKQNPTGFSTEYILVNSSSRYDNTSETNFSGKIMVTRGMGTSPASGITSGSLGAPGSAATAYSQSQVIVSTGKTGTGYIRLNANPNDERTPYIDIVERTGSGVYDVQLKARLGDLSGVYDNTIVPANPGFGLYTDNVYLKGVISSSQGNIGGIDIGDTRLAYKDFWQISSSADGNNPGGFISSSRFKVSGDGLMSASAAHIEGNLTATTGQIGGFTIGSASLETITFRLSASQDPEDPASFISSSRFKVSSVGSFTASRGQIGNWKVGNFGTGTWNDGIIASDNWYKIMTGEVPGAALRGGTIPLIGIWSGSSSHMKMHYTNKDNWGFEGQDNGKIVFQLGSTNKIAGTSFDEGKMYVEDIFHISASQTLTDPIGFISSSKFKVSPDGQITASAGKIADWTIVDKRLYSFTTKTTNKFGISLGADDQLITIHGDAGDGRNNVGANNKDNVMLAIGQIATDKWGIKGWDKNANPTGAPNTPIFELSTDKTVIAGFNFSEESLDGGAMHINKGGFISSSAAGGWHISSSAHTPDPVGFISSSAFKVSADGRMTASAGQIAGWHIDGDHIIKEFSLEGSTSRVRLNARAGTNNKYHDGYGFVFYRNNSDIDDADNGAVKTVKIGQIGNPDSPDYDSGTYYGIQILNSGSGGYKDIFRADESGGKIAGWTFNDASLDGGAMHVNKSGFISSSNWQISSSTSNSDPIGFISSSAFKVSADGRMTASAGKIGGVTIGTDSLGNDALFQGAGTWGNSNTGFFVNEYGTFSLKDKLKWDGTTLTVNGDITVANSGSFAQPTFYENFQNTLDAKKWTKANLNEVLKTTTPDSTPYLGMMINNSSGDGWTAGAIGETTFLRSQAPVMELDVVVNEQWASTFIGLVPADSTVSDINTDSNFEHLMEGVLFQENDIRVYSDINNNGTGTAQGTNVLGADVWTTGTDTFLRVRITLKPSGGARYEVYKDGDFTTPHSSYDTTGNTKEELKPAIFIYQASTTVQITLGQLGVGSPVQATRISGNSITTGEIQSNNWGTTTGTNFNLNEGDLIIGGSTGQRFEFSGSANKMTFFSGSGAKAIEIDDTLVGDYAGIKITDGILQVSNSVDMGADSAAPLYSMNLNQSSGASSNRKAAMFVITDNTQFDDGAITLTDFAPPMSCPAGGSSKTGTGNCYSYGVGAAVVAIAETNIDWGGTQPRNAVAILASAKTAIGGSPQYSFYGKNGVLYNSSSIMCGYSTTPGIADNRSDTLFSAYGADSMPDVDYYILARTAANTDVFYVNDAGVLYNAGEGRFTGDLIAYYSSDERMKDNIITLGNPIEKIKQIRGVSFDWNSNGPEWTRGWEGEPDGKKRDIGIIAQEVQKVLPEAVIERDDGYLAVDYEKIVPLLVEGIKEQQTTIEDLQSRIKKLENR